MLVLEEVSHPNIMKIYELLYGYNYYYIVSEYIKEGDLFDLIGKRKENNLTERKVIQIVKQIYMALNYMHKRNIVHRNIKPENILISSLANLEIKLTDFGYCAYQDVFQDETDKLNEVVGKCMFLSPEIILKQNYDSKVDIWSVGIITYILLFGLTPFNGKTDI